MATEAAASPYEDQQAFEEYNEEERGLQDDEEFEEGIVCIAAAFSSAREVAAGAISISLPLSDMVDKEFYTGKILEYSTKISQLLGHF